MMAQVKVNNLTTAIFSLGKLPFSGVEDQFFIEETKCYLTPHDWGRGKAKQFV